jgi:hypothetical protein
VKDSLGKLKEIAATCLLMPFVYCSISYLFMGRWYKTFLFLPVECRWTMVQAPAVRIEALGYFVPGNYEIFELHLIF